MRVFLLLAALVAATPAAAQQASGQPAQAKGSERPGEPPATIVAEPVAMMIAAFDANGDARVTRAEFDAGLRHSWDSIDTTHKGWMSYIEFGDWAEKWLGDRNALPNPFEVDHDGDNRITYEELAARFDLYFTRFDTNKDGVLDRSELVALRSPMQIGRGRDRGKARQPGE